MPSPVVVLVMSHTMPEQVARLVGRIREGDDVFVAVHHDPTGPPLALPAGDNVALLPDARPCRWGRLDLPEAVLRSLRWVTAAVPEHGWVLLVSGQDYPLRPMRDIEAELRTSTADAFVMHHRLDAAGPDQHPWQALARRRYLRRLRLPGTHRSVPFPRVRHPYRDGTSLFGGGVWINLGPAAVRHVLDQPELEQRLRRFLAWSPNPDETMVHTLLLNGSEHLRVVNDHRRYIRWVRGSAHPKTVTVDDLPDLRASDAFFTRKVDARKDSAVLDELDRLARDA